MIGCPYCQRVFGGQRAYLDAHRWGTCAGVRELRARGMHTDAAGVWHRSDPTNAQAVLIPRQPGRPKHGDPRHYVSNGQPR